MGEYFLNKSTIFSHTHPLSPPQKNPPQKEKGLQNGPNSSNLNADSAGGIPKRDLDAAQAQLLQALQKITRLEEEKKQIEVSSQSTRLRHEYAALQTKYSLAIEKEEKLQGQVDR